MVNKKQTKRNTKKKPGSTGVAAVEKKTERKIPKEKELFQIDINMKNFDKFKEMRKEDKEVAGSIKLKCPTGKCKLKKTFLVQGEDQSVDADLIPNCEIQFHTHPSYPQPPGGQDLIDYIHSYYKKNKDIQIDSIIQTVSDADLNTFSKSLINGKTHCMFVFAPEGVYVMLENYSYLPILENHPHEKSIQAILDNRSDHFLDTRNDFIRKEMDSLLDKLKKKENKSEAKQKTLLKKFQKDMGRNFVKMMNIEFSLLNCLYFSWDDKCVKFKINPNFIENN